MAFGFLRRAVMSEPLEEMAENAPTIFNNTDEDLNDSTESNLGENLEEGQLSVDVYQTPTHLIVMSTIAGVKNADLEVGMQGDVLTIRGKRNPGVEIPDNDYLVKECYWGNFSRSIVLPVEVKGEEAVAQITNNGVLTIKLPKIQRSRTISVKIVD